ERRYAEILETDAVGIDMEAATILAVGPAVGLDVGGILVAHGNRVDDSWVVHYESRQLAMMAAACRAAAALVERTDRGGQLPPQSTGLRKRSTSAGCDSPARSCRHPGASVRSSRGSRTC